MPWCEMRTHPVSTTVKGSSLRTMHTYDVISESVRNPHELAAELTRRSEQGWEVVHIVYDGAAWFHAFIRHEGRVSVAPFAGAVDAGASMASPASGADAVSRVGQATPSAVAPAAAQTAMQPAVQASTPVTSTTPSPTVAGGSVPDVPANWYKDPSGRFELRYWNGTAWTEHVATGGRQSVDPPRS